MIRCAQCGQRFEANRVGRPPRFCCVFCRNRWWNLHRENRKEQRG